MKKKFTVPPKRRIGALLTILLLFFSILLFNTPQAFAQCKSMIDVDFDNWNNRRYSIADIKNDFNNKVKPWTASTYRGVSGPGAPSNLIENTPQETRIVDGTLRAEYLKNDASGRSGGFLFDPFFDGVEEAYLEYKLKFDDNFFWATGGKLPGLGGSTKGINSETTGLGAIPSGTRYDESGSGFSARLMWRRNREQTNTPYLILYSYFAKKKDGSARKDRQNGDDYRIFTGLKDNKWYTIRQYIKLNTPGKDDGIVKMWIDGNEVWSNTKMNIRQSGKGNLKINALIMNTYRGGSRTDPVWHSPRTEYTFFDDFKVWTGCANPPGGNIDEITNLSAPGVVKQGQEVSLAVNYDVSAKRDITVLFQRDQDPWTLIEQATTTVEAGSGTANIKMTIPMDTPILTDAYQFQVFIAPTGGNWDDRLANSELKDVDVLEAEVKGPFLGTPTPIPGILEMENYDKGGAGISYNDTDAINRGDANFRTEDGVDIVNTDAGRGVGYISNGEWVEYTVNIEQSATYNMKIRYSSLNGGGMLGIKMDGTDVGTGIDIPSTGDWSMYADLEESITLPAGEHVLRFTIETNGFNLDNIAFTNNLLSVTDHFANSFSVFPNPSASGLFQLSKERTYKIFNVVGELVTKGKGTVIDLTGASPGLYFLQTDENLVVKLLK